MNLSETISKGARYFPEKPALIYKGRSCSYRELDNAVNRASAHFRDLGLRPGDRAALYAENRPEWIISYFGIIRLGATVVCISSAYKSSELHHLLGDSRPSMVITTEGLVGHIPKEAEGSPPLHIVVMEQDRLLSSIWENPPQEPVDFEIPRCAPDETCVILYTGGTTGIPKGAMLTHQNLLYTSQNVCYHEGTSHKDVMLCFMPLNHVFAGNHIMNAAFYACAALDLHRSFDMDEILASISENGVTRLYAVPTVYIRFLNNPESHPYLRAVRYSFSAATSMPYEVVRRWKETFGLDIYEAYGMTETSSLATFNHMYRHKAGSVGTPAGLVEVRLVDPEGREVGPDEPGEVQVRGPNVMKGYFDRPKETSAAMQDGWLKSGDIGRMDREGYFYILDRVKDMIISGGLNIYPREVEEVLYTHQAVEECAVVGLEHPEYGECVTAFVQAKQGARVDEVELIEFCKQRMASYKAPKRVVFERALPKSPQGKILKRELRAPGSD
ncbi:MAG: class I adenylate-forming enzyme family protein [Desulfobacteraceae bacterium]